MVYKFSLIYKTVIVARGLLLRWRRRPGSSLGIVVLILTSGDRLMLSPLVRGAVGMVLVIIDALLGQFQVF